MVQDSDGYIVQSSIREQLNIYLIYKLAQIRSKYNLLEQLSFLKLSMYLKFVFKEHRTHSLRG